MLRALTVTSALAVAVIPRTAVAQAADNAQTNTTVTTTTTTAAPAAPADTEEPTVLSPFVVDASEDKGSYKANSTLAGTRVRTDLKDVASAITVVTSQFLQDTGATNAQDLLVYTPSTEVAGIRGNFSGAAGTAVVQENTVSATTRVRGLDSADNTRDYFLSDIPWDSFDVGRVDLQRGPNSILFGTGSPAGIINVSTNGAAFNNSYNITNRVDEYGSLRDSVMINQEIIPGVFAIRLGALQDNEKFEQQFAFCNTTRYYGAFRFDPQLFGKDSHTQIRGNYEWGKQTSDNPRDLPPTDEITPWFQATDQFGNPSYNKVTENQFSLNNASTLSATGLPGGSGGPLSQNFFQLGGFSQGRSYWADVINYYEATPQNENGGSTGTVAPTGNPIKVITAEANTGLANAGNGIAGLTTFRPDAIPPFSLIADYEGTYGAVDGFTSPQKAVPGGAYYTDKVLTDPSIFNFYKALLDGPNKHEWKNWTAFNIAVDQTFFDDRLGFEFSYDQQHYVEGAEPFLQGENYAINIDINQTYADGTPNPNVGRPYVANATSGGEDDNYQTTTDRYTYRFTPTAEIRSTDFFAPNSIAAYLLGKSDFTGLYEKNTVVQSTFQFSEYATTPDYVTSNSLAATAADTENSSRSFEFLAYVGPSLLNASSASGAHLNNLNYVIAPALNEQTLNFNSTWNKPTDPSAPGYVNPAAPYSYTSTSTGATTTNSTQAQNPANYVGWSNEQISYLMWSNPADQADLINTASRTRYTDESEGITWQGYLLGGDLVPSLGWRKDKVTNYQSNAITDPATGYTSLSFPDNDLSRTDVHGTSKTWGGVYHFPKVLMEKLPGDLTFSVLFDRSENFKPDAARLSLAGLPIPNATGTTTEYGFVVTGLSDKISLKVDWFKTLVKNASLGETDGNSIAGLGSNAYFIADGTIWGYGWAASLQDGLAGNLGNGASSTTPGTNFWDYGAGSGFAPGTPQYIAINAASAAIVNAWVNAPLPATFFSSYALTPQINPTIAKATGILHDAWINGYADADGPVNGSGSNFGDHQTTVDNLSKGVEIELTAQPTRSWNVSLNYTHVNATHEDIDPATQVFISQMTGFFNGPGGQLREWGNSGSPISQQWNSSIVAPWTVQLNDQGHEAPEVAPWRLNLVSTYTFDRGPIKGVFIGGGLRIEAARILGYKYDPNFKNINSDDPNYANVASVTQGGLNVNEPFYGTNDTHVDMWFGYTRKLYKNVNWRIQLNLQSVGEKDHLVAAGYEPDGSLALARIQEGMGWRLENSFDF